MTTLEATDRIFSWIRQSSLMNGAQKINGAIYKHERPVSSDKEDILITVLPITAAQLQEAVASVSIFIPMMGVSINGTQNWVTNHVRVAELAEQGETVLKEFGDQEIQFYLQQQMMGVDEEAHQTVLIFRINIFSINV